MRSALALVVALVALPVLAATSSAASTLIVGPGGYSSIQDAVDAAQPGDTILVKPGVYQEEVIVSVPDVIVTGEDRDTTILDGGSLLGNGITVVADGVTLRSLTAKNYATNGFVMSHVENFVMTDLRSIDNREYGIYAIHSQHGDISYSEASGSGDAGFYIGETEHCDCDVHHNVAHGNMLAYSGTANSYVRIHHNEFYNNRAGIVPNVLPQEMGFDQETQRVYGLQVHTEIYENYIHDNNNMAAPETGIWQTAHVPAGTGILVAGGWMNDIHDNVIEDNTLWGVAVFWLTTLPRGNLVHDNTISGSRVGIWWDEGGEDNCFVDNAISGFQSAATDPAPLPTCPGLVGDIPCPAETTDLAACRASSAGVWNVPKWTEWIALRALNNIPPDQDL